MIKKCLIRFFGVVISFSIGVSAFVYWETIKTGTCCDGPYQGKPGLILSIFYGCLPFAHPLGFKGGYTCRPTCSVGYFHSTDGEFIRYSIQKVGNEVQVFQEKSKWLSRGYEIQEQSAGGKPSKVPEMRFVALNKNLDGPAKYLIFRTDGDKIRIIQASTNWYAHQFEYYWAKTGRKECPE